MTANKDMLSSCKINDEDASKSLLIDRFHKSDFRVIDIVVFHLYLLYNMNFVQKNYILYLTKIISRDLIRKVHITCLKLHLKNFYLA